MNLILASQSPRRRELLLSITNDFSIHAADIDETPLSDEKPEQYVSRLALEKARVVSAQNPNAMVVGSDTSVVINGIILGKPIDKDDSKRMLTLLSGNTHQVMTAFSLVRDNSEYTEVVITDVSFTELSEQTIDKYWLTGEPQDKAGSYAIQGIGGKFVKKINGSVSSVIGLPLVEFEKALNKQL